MTDPSRTGPNNAPPALPDGLAELIGPYLGRQRWYAGTGDPSRGGAPSGVEVLMGRRLDLDRDGEGSEVALHQAVVESEGACYHLLIGERPGATPAEFLQGHAEAVLGSVGGFAYYDALVHPDLSRRLLEIVTDGRAQAVRVRPVGAEQSNTSLVYDDRVILKVFRRLLEGANPDVEVTTALARVGFAQVAAPVAVWRLEGWDLAFAQQYLAGGSEGWALALTSLRDLFNSEVDDPAEAGGDFAGEASRLGGMTAEMHLAMVEAFGAGEAPEAPASTGTPLPAPLGTESWSALVDSIELRLERAWSMIVSGAERSQGATATPGGPGAQSAAAAVHPLRGLRSPGPAIRVHGDYHLGQVMQTDAGWFVLDFEGEPARPLAERVAPTSPLKDVAGMLRSFDYAARFALTERDPSEMERATTLAASWEARNREAFVEGYRGATGISELLATGASAEIVLSAFELDKALYELDYERAYRPEWLPIPLAAIRSLLGRLGG